MISDSQKFDILDKNFPAIERWTKEQLGGFFSDDLLFLHEEGEYQDFDLCKKVDETTASAAIGRISVNSGGIVELYYQYSIAEPIRAEITVEALASYA